MELVWEIMSEQLYFARVTYSAEILSFVLMSNHFHLLIRTPESNLSKMMAVFMRETSRHITKSSERLNQTYGQRHFRCVLGSFHYMLNSYKYIYYNPVKAGICARAEDYPYSTLHGKLGRRNLLIPVVEDSLLFNDVEGTLNWINRPPLDEHWNWVRTALRKSEFRLARDSSSKKDNPLETNTL